MASLGGSRSAPPGSPGMPRVLAVLGLGGGPRARRARTSARPGAPGRSTVGLAPLVHRGEAEHQADGEGPGLRGDVARPPDGTRPDSSSTSRATASSSASPGSTNPASAPSAARPASSLAAQHPRSRLLATEHDHHGVRARMVLGLAVRAQARQAALDQLAGLDRRRCSNGAGGASSATPWRRPPSPPSSLTRPAAACLSPTRSPRGARRRLAADAAGADHRGAAVPRRILVDGQERTRARRARAGAATGPLSWASGTRSSRFAVDPQPAIAGDDGAGVRASPAARRARRGRGGATRRRG